MTEDSAAKSTASTESNDAADFRRLTSPGHYLLVADWLEPSVAKLELLEAGGFERAFADPSGGQGRSAAAILSIPDSEVRLHMRPFRRGGWLAPLRGHRLMSLRRPISELRTTAALVLAGARVPQPALVMGHRDGFLWNAALGTVFEEGAIDGGVWLKSSPDSTRLLAAAAAAGRSIRGFHDAGGRHRDLHIGNLLVRENESGAEVIVVDLDGATLVSTVTPARRMRELMRLHRSLIKRGWVDAIGPRGYARFFDAYTQGDRRLRAALLSHLSRERRRVALHALGYRARRRSLTG